jgi:hypothetical protein
MLDNNHQDVTMPDRSLLTVMPVLMLYALTATKDARAQMPDADPSHDVVAFCRMHGTLDHPETSGIPSFFLPFRLVRFDIEPYNADSLTEGVWVDGYKDYSSSGKRFSHD